MSDYRDWQQLLESSFREFVGTVGAYLPSLLGAIILLLAGFIIAWLLKWTILRVGTGLDRLASRAGIGIITRLRWPLSNILAGIAYWVVILFFATAAAEGLGLPGLADWLSKLISYLPSVLAALLIIFAGFILGGMARDKIITSAVNANVLHAELLGGAVRAVVIVLTIVIGLSQMGIDIRIVEYLLTISVAALFAAFALAFGLGAGSSVANIIASRNVKKHYNVGQRVTVGDVEGKILELSSSYVVLDTSRGRTLIPAKVFDEKVSVLLEADGADER